MHRPATSTQGGFLGGLTSLLLTLFVLLTAGAGYYAISQPDLARQTIEGDLTRLRARTPRPVVRWLSQRVLKMTAAAFESIGPRARAYPVLREPLDRLAPILTLVMLRVLLLALALPLMLGLQLWGLLEGLWARDRIAAQSGFPSALSFAIGKWLMLLGLFCVAAYITLPLPLGPGGLTAGVATALAAGGYLTGRNLPLHF